MGSRPLKIPSATQRALAQRAIGMASTMELWVKEICDELKKQGIEFDRFDWSLSGVDGTAVSVQDPAQVLCVPKIQDARPALAPRTSIAGSSSRCIDGFLRSGR